MHGAQYQAYGSITTTLAATMSDIACAQERADKPGSVDIDAALAALSSAHERSA